ncbi:MAG: metal ABC transporter permease [Acetobacteraceae bacterium]
MPAEAPGLALAHHAVVVGLGSAAFGLAAGAVGCFMLLRGRALITDAAAHATLPGVAGAFLIGAALGWDGRALPLLLAGAALTALAAVLVVQGLAGGGRIRDDAAMALVLSVGFGLGVVLLSVVQSLPVAGQAGLKGFILGQAAGMLAGDAVLIGALALFALAALALLFRPLALLCFDRDFAVAVGLPVRALDLALLGLMLAVAVVGLNSVGLILVVGLMVIPAATARLLTDRLDVMLPLAAAAGALSAGIGASVSASAPGLPTGGTIVLAAAALFALALIAAPGRGLLALAQRRSALSLAVARDHALRLAFETQERDRRGEALALDEVARGAGWSGWQRRLVPLWLRAAGLVRPAGPGLVALTERGRRRAHALTRRHRLWEHYLQSAGGIAPGAAHRAADEVEHTLPEDVAREAAVWLAANDPARLAPGEEVPPPGEVTAR